MKKFKFIILFFLLFFNFSFSYPKNFWNPLKEAEEEIKMDGGLAKYPRLRYFLK